MPAFGSDPPIGAGKPRWQPALVLFLVGLAPLALPAAMAFPNLAIVKRAELACAGAASGVFCEARTWPLVGPPALRRFGPVTGAANAFAPVVQSASEPQSGQRLSTLVIRSAGAELRPFAAMNATPQSPSTLAVTPDVAEEAAEVTRLVDDPSAPPLTIRRSQPYPVGLLMFDVPAVLIAAAILIFWTPPFWRAAWLHARGAPAQAAAAPLLDLVQRGVSLLMTSKPAGGT